MKANWNSVLLCLVLVVMLSACGTGGGSTAPAASAEPTAIPSAEPTAAPTAMLPDELLKPDVAETSSPQEEAFALAKSFEGKDLSELVEALGEPVSSSYVSSCLGSGQDGELKYDGFTVVTYREGSAETVTYVQADD